MKRKILTKLMGMLILGSFLFIASCLKEGETAEGETPIPAIAQIIPTENTIPSYEEFKAKIVQNSEGLYEIEDVVFTEEGLKHYYLTIVAEMSSPDLRATGSGQYYNATHKREIYYCVSTTFFFYNDVVNNMRDAANAWESAADVDFIHLSSYDVDCGNQVENSKIRIIVRPGGFRWDGVVGSMYYPYGGKYLTLYDGAFYPFQLYKTILHELGHALGLRHEQDRAPADWQWLVPCNGNTSPTDNLTDYDSSSIMHYDCGVSTLIPKSDLSYNDRVGIAKVYGAPKIRSNVALGKIATQIDNLDVYHIAYRAIDGNTDGNHWNNSTTHTASTNQPWWQVNLNSSYALSKIVLFNRTDCCQERLANFDVKILDNSDNLLWTYYQERAVGNSLEIPVPEGTRGQQIRIQLRGQTYLQLAEVQVYATVAYTWGVNSNDAIWRWNGSTWENIPGGLKHVSVGADGTVWGVNSADMIYRRDGSSWTQIYGGLKQISVGSASQVWGVASNDTIYRWNGSTWENIPGGLKHVSVGADGTVWGVNSADMIYRRDGNSWTNIPGRLKQISVGSASQVWGVASNDTIWRWNGSTWENIPGGLKHVSVAADGTVWGVNSADMIYRRDGSSWTQIYGGLKQVSAGSN